MERVNRSILTFDELLSKKDDYKNVFNKQTQEYIESLLNLEVSAFRTQKELSNEDRSVLMELRFFRNLVAYNIYYRIQKLYDKNNIKYNLNNLYNGYTLNYELGLNDLLELINVTIDNDGNSKIIMYNPTNKSISDLYEIQKNRISELEKKVVFSLGKDDMNNEEISNWKLLDKLKKLSHEDIMHIVEELNKNNSLQRSITALALTDFGLNIDKDFKKDKDGLKLEEKVVAPVLIKRRDNRVIFK